MLLFSDPENAQYIVDNSGVNPVKALLKSNNTDILTNTITTLLYLHNNETDPEINTTDVKQLVSDVQKSDDKRLANLATIFLQDVCSITQTSYIKGKV